MHEDTTGRLLVASPRIADGVFRRAVVIMLHHDAAGAHGLVLNKPLDVGVDRVLPGWGSVATGPSGLYQGGPVGLDTALALGRHGGDASPTGMERLFDSLGVVDLDGEPDAVGSVVDGLRIFAGYSGWEGGQLEGEIAGGSWYVVDRHADDVFTGEPRTLWRRVLRRQQPPVSYLSTYPDDPEWN